MDEAKWAVVGSPHNSPKRAVFALLCALANRAKKGALSPAKPAGLAGGAAPAAERPVGGGPPQAEGREEDCGDALRRRAEDDLGQRLSLLTLLSQQKEGLAANAGARARVHARVHEVLLDCLSSLRIGASLDMSSLNVLSSSLEWCAEEGSEGGAFLQLAESFSELLSVQILHQSHSGLWSAEGEAVEDSLEQQEIRTALLVSCVGRLSWEACGLVISHLCLAMIGVLGEEEGVEQCEEKGIVCWDSTVVTNLGYALDALSQALSVYHATHAQTLKKLGSHVHLAQHWHGDLQRLIARAPPSLPLVVLQLSKVYSEAAALNKILLAKD